MNRPDTKELKRRARTTLNGQHATLAGITLLLTSLNLLLNYLSLMASPSDSGVLGTLISWGCSFLVNMVYFILMAGLHHIYLDLCSNRSFRWTDLFSAFTEHPEPVAIYSILYYVLTLIFMQIGLWWLTETIDWIFYWGSSRLLLATAILIVYGILYVFARISLSMVLFVHADNPDLSFREMLEESWRLMDGVRLRYLYLQFSFLGMYLLCILSFGIGFLFVEPYINTANGYFYKEISGH
ncbi:MAG: DUF975 family protein [Lachnospiraceae bacterium]|nr:DUF975 family protein [Lachnospiraceae bacterium]